MAVNDHRLANFRVRRQSMWWEWEILTQLRSLTEVPITYHGGRPDVASIEWCYCWDTNRITWLGISLANRDITKMNVLSLAHELGHIATYDPDWGQALVMGHRPAIQRSEINAWDWARSALGDYWDHDSDGFRTAALATYGVT